MSKPSRAVVELGEYIIQQSQNEKFRYTPELAGQMNSILTAIKLGAKVINRELSKSNSYGMDQVATECDMTVVAHKRFMDALINREVVAGVASTGLDDFVSLPRCQDKQLVCLITPLDGTKQIDVNVSIGTLFSIYKRVTPVGQPVELRDFLQPGSNQLCAGYVIYGTSTMIVFTMGSGVAGFTLDPSLGTFYLSHPDMRIPEDGKIYSVNGGKRKAFPQGVVEYINHCQEKGFACRYIGSMVADFHRNLLKGGIFIYPPTFKDPKPSVSMIYQCNPLGFLCEQAGGRCSDGFTRVLDIEPVSFADRVPFFCGSKKMVTHAESFMAKKKMHDGGWCFQKTVVPAQPAVNGAH